MNLFYRKIENSPDNEKRQNEFEHFEIGTDWEESYTKNYDKEVPAKETYYPNALLFRNLLEGTSFDRRINKKVEMPEKSVKAETEPEGVNDTAFRQKLSMVKIPYNKKPEKSGNFCKPIKKKKFITEKEQSRLERIVKKVLGPVKD